MAISQGVVVRVWTLESSWPGFKSQLCRLPSVRPQAGHLSPLRLSFFIRGTEGMMALASEVVLNTCSAGTSTKP